MIINPCSQPDFYQRLMRHDHEQRMNKVVLMTCIMMIVEIVGGWLLGAMALLADGLHRVTHSVALGVSDLPIIMCVDTSMIRVMAFAPVRLVTLLVLRVPLF